jgi:hypothetical protein
MNKYELLTEKTTDISIVKNGILSYLMIRDIEIYETYLNLNDNITKEIKIYYYQTNTNYHQIE